MNNSISNWMPTDIIEQSKGHIVSDMDGEKVMLSVQKGKYYNLGDIGGKIWDLIYLPRSLQQIVDALVLEYDINPEICFAQVASFLEHLLSEGLIQDKKAI